MFSFIVRNGSVRTASFTKCVQSVSSDSSCKGYLWSTRYHCNLHCWLCNPFQPSFASIYDCNGYATKIIKIFGGARFLPGIYLEAKSFGGFKLHNRGHTQVPGRHDIDIDMLLVWTPPCKSSTTIITLSLRALCQSPQLTVIGRGQDNKRCSYIDGQNGQPLGIAKI